MPRRALTFDAECGGSSPDPLFHADRSWGAGFGLDSDFMGDLRQLSVGGGLCTIRAERHATPSGRAFASAEFTRRAAGGAAKAQW
jgi:hypothetical protein